MKIYCIKTGLLGTNSYFLVDEKTSSAVLIDCAEYYNKIQGVAESNNFKIKAVLLTHAHFDHSGCAKKLQDDGAKIYVSKIDAVKVRNGDTLSDRFCKPFDTFVPDYEFGDGEILNFGEIKVKTMLTPGHTDGSAVFIVGNKIFSGDTLLCRSYGRTDFPTGDEKALKQSINKLFSLDGDYEVYPGHEDFTTLGEERKFNPIKYL